MILNYLSRKLEQEYYNLSLWYFVSFIIGIVCYFTLFFHLSIILVVIIFTASWLLVLLRKYGIFWQFLAGLIIAFSSGLLVSKYRVANLNIVIIPKTTVSHIEGTIETIKPTVKGVQIVLNQVKVNKLNLQLSKIRISVPDKYSKEVFINDRVSLLAKLFKPQGRVLPGSYDFGFYSYFSAIGATGYAMSNLAILAHNYSTTNSIIYKIRKIIYDRLLAAGSKIQGNFAAAILLGETKGIDRQLMKNMRQSGISHILCVSGLHLSLIAMIFFIAIRFLLNLSDYIAFNFNIKMIAGICSLISSYGYLQLSGMQIAATRAFIMTAIFIVGVIIGRRVYPLRSIAIAAGFILCFNPEYVFSPSFQLSFVAVLSLIAGYEFYLKNKWILGESKGIFAQVRFYLASNIYSSFLASIVTAPVVINQFYIFSTYSIPMNLIAVPIMSFFLMPLAIICCFLMPIGLDAEVIQLMGFFIDIIIKAAGVVVKLPASVWYFGYITPLSLIIFLFGFFWICLWQTSWRIWGGIIMLVSFVLMLNSPKPDFIFDIDSNIIGIKNKQHKLEIHANKISNFNRQYWANWFGQQDAEVFQLHEHIFTTLSGKKIAINYGNNSCYSADVQLNIGSNCPSGELQLSKTFLEEAKVIAIFCNNKKCWVKYDNDLR